MPQLMGDDARVELGILPAESQIVGVDVERGSQQRSDGIDAPETSLLVCLVIEDSHVGFRRMADKCVDAPRSVPDNPAHGIEALSHVRTFSYRDDSLGAIRELLATGAEREAVLGIRRKRQVDERLMNIQLVTIGGAWSTLAFILKIALELTKEPRPGPQLQVQMGHVPLRQEPVGVLWTLAPLRVVEVLISLADVATER